MSRSYYSRPITPPYLRPGTQAFEKAFPTAQKNAEILFGNFAKRIPVAETHMPGLRALVRNQFPKLSVHQQARIVESARPWLGGLFTGGFAADVMDTIGLKGKYAADAKSPEEFSEAIGLLASSNEAQGYLNYFADQALRSGGEGSVGFGDAQTANAGVAGKQTLSAHFIQPGADALDTTIPKKVESEVAADFFSYFAANPEHGIYNAMYLQDEQWKKQIRFGGELALPRSGYDQQFFQSFDLLPQRENSQPVEMELFAGFERDLYALYAAKDPRWDPLKDLAPHHDPIMGVTRVSHFCPSNSLRGDGDRFYPDPDDPHSSAEVNRLGFRPVNDAWQFPDEPSRWLPVVTQEAPAEKLAINALVGFSSWQRPTSWDSFPA